MSASLAPVPVEGSLQKSSPRAASTAPCSRLGPTFTRKKISRCSCGPTTCLTAVQVLAAMPRKISVNFLRPMAHGTFKASLIPPLPATIFSGFAPASSAAEPIIGGASLCALLPLISNPRHATASATIGPSATTTFLRTTTRSSLISASSSPKKTFPTRSEKRIIARAIVVAASACESARLLLNSKSTVFPAGLANSSGAVGKYLTDSVGSSGHGYIPQLEKMPPHNHDGTGGMHMYMPWWKFDRKNDFPRGYHIEFGGGRDMPGIGMFNGMNREQEGYGLTLKQRARKEYGCHIGFAGRGEMIPNPDTYCEIDPEVVDEWGIPVLRFHFKWSDYELLQAKDMQETFKAIVETMGGEYKTHTSIRGDLPFGIEPGGKIIHEVGTARMGADPKTSVLNGFCQAHDVKNLFVTDGAPLVTNPDKNPTLTIMALSWRASEYLLEEAKKGNL